MASSRFTPVQIDMAGVNEVLHSPEIHSELMGHAAQMAARCHADAERNLGFTLEYPAYRCAVDRGRWEYLGVVFTASKLGRADEAANHTLESNNH